MSERVLVSICCLTFNHAPFIRKCLDGFLMQEGNFDIEVLIHDDASTDGTREIIEEYSNKYPGVFFPIFQIENQYKKGGRSFFAKYNFPRCKGKYIALCEGDDYWTDPSKLYQQVNFLENNHEYVITGHDAIKVSNDAKIISNSCLPEKHKRDYTKKELKQAQLILTLTMCFRNIPSIKNFPKEGLNLLVEDLFIISVLGQYGKYKYFTTINPAVYRVHSGGIWSLKSELEKNTMLNITAKQLRDYFSRSGDREMKMYHSKKVLMYSINIFRLKIEAKKSSIQFIKCCIRFIIDNKLIISPLLFLKYIYFKKCRKKRIA